MKTRYLIGVMVIVAAAVVEYAVVSLVDLNGSSGGSGSKGPSAAPASPASTAPPPVYDVRGLIKTTHKLLGVAIDGAPANMAPINAFATAIGTKPNIIELYENFADDFDASAVRNAYQYGALPLISWEPKNAPLAKIAAGDQDAYLTTWAKAVRTLNLPVAIAFAHEMNGDWYSWGPQATKPADFIAAWRHIHNVFAAAGATNVIWVWAPNVINPRPKVKLKPLYPGDAYVDWVGMIGYYTHHGQQTFSALYGPTTRAMRKFTNKPILIVETGAEPGGSRPGEIADLFRGVTHTPGFLGFVWFDNHGTGNWRIDADRPAIAAFRRAAGASVFGSDVREMSANG